MALPLKKDCVLADEQQRSGQIRRSPDYGQAGISAQIVHAQKVNLYNALSISIG
jgi:hypothetical protein